MITSLLSNILFFVFKKDSIMVFVGNTDSHAIYIHHWWEYKSEIVFNSVDSEL